MGLPGKKAQIYRHTSWQLGNLEPYASGSPAFDAGWKRMDRAIDIEWGVDDPDTIDTSGRSTGWVSSRPKSRPFSVEFGFRRMRAYDSEYQVLRDAWNSHAVLYWMVLDTANIASDESHQGIMFPAHIMSVTDNWPLTGAQDCTVILTTGFAYESNFSDPPFNFKLLVPTVIEYFAP